MTEYDSADSMNDLFRTAGTSADPEFVSDVMQHAPGIDRRLLIRRTAIGLGLALVAFLLEDYAISLSSLFLTSIVEMDDSLVTQLLAPINTVGGLLSAVLLILRATYKRLFRH